MDAETLARIAIIAATRCDVRLDQSAVEELQSRLAHINEFRVAREPLREQAVEAAFTVLFVEGARGASGVVLRARDIGELFGRLCPLPPIC